jgi:hypothetical protein
MKPDSAGKRSAEKCTIHGGVHPLLYVNHQSRYVGLPVYKNRFQLQGDNDLWETYILADHDDLSLDYPGLLDLAARIQARDEELNPLPYLSHPTCIHGTKCPSPSVMTRIHSTWTPFGSTSHPASETT